MKRLQSIYVLVALLPGVLASKSWATIAHVQTNECLVSSGASASCAFASSVATHDLLIVTVFGYGDTDVTDAYIPTISDNAGDEFQIAPLNQGDADIPGGTVVYYCPSAVGGATTITASVSTAQSWQILITEVAGAAKSTPLINWTRMPADSSGGESSQPISVTIAGNNYIYALGGDAARCPYNLHNVVSFDSNYTQRWSDGGSANATYWLNLSDDEVSGSFTVQPTMTATSCWGISPVALKDAQVFALVFSDTNQVSPLAAQNIVQVTNGGGISGSNGTFKTFNASVTAGDKLLAVGACGADITAFSDSLSNTWTALTGGVGYMYGVWMAPAGSTGADLVTLACSNVATLNLMELRGVSGVDASAYLFSNASVLTPSSITTTGANDLILALSSGESSSSDYSAGGTITSTTGWGAVNESASHQGYGSLWQQIGGPGTYSVSFTNNNTSYSSLVGMVALSLSSTPALSGAEMVGVISGGVIK